jgi:hypothetical protein
MGIKLGAFWSSLLTRQAWCSLVSRECTYLGQSARHIRPTPRNPNYHATTPTKGARFSVDVGTTPNCDGILSDRAPVVSGGNPPLPAEGDGARYQRGDTPVGGAGVAVGRGGCALRHEVGECKAAARAPLSSHGESKTIVRSSTGLASCRRPTTSP